jgi:UDP-N-acetylmuramoyl-L-alanyl-D-glutamate--2,6-diaminopimelate ligase
VSTAPRDPTTPHRLGELLHGAGHAEYIGCAADTPIVDLDMDSRRITDGWAFFAFTGTEHDGHRWVDDAIQRGARVVILERGRRPPPDHPHVLLSDATRALPIVAANLTGWPGRAMRVAGVTGTNGKTTTTTMVAAIFEAAGRPHVRIGTTGHWIASEHVDSGYTTPFPLELQRALALGRSRGASDAVMEVSSHGLDQRRVEPLRYRAVGFTSFSQDHLDYHSTMDAYFAAKALLASAFLAADGTAVAMIDEGDAGSRFLTATPSTATRWRASRGAHLHAELVATRWSIEQTGIHADIATPAGTFTLSTPLVGAYNLDNALVATGIALAHGVSLDAIAAGLAAARVPGRLEPVSVEGVHGPRVLVDYAHTPDAVERALAAIRPSCAGRLIVLLGCGGDRDPTKRPLMGRAAAEGADVFYATSDNPRTEDPDLILDQMLAGISDGRSSRAHVVRERDRRAAIAQAIAEATDDDVILVAGKGHETYQIIGTTRQPFDDREEARTALRRRLS